MTTRKSDFLFSLLFIVPALFALGQAFFPDAAIYKAGTDHTATSLKVASVSKLALLMLAAVFAHLSAQGLASAHDEVASAWRRLSIGFVLFSLGQLSLGWYQIVRNQTAPYPSVADALFLAAYPFFFVSLLGFLRGYREAGFSVDSATTQGRLAGFVSVGCLAVALPLLKPAAFAPTHGYETALNLAYPVLDLALVVPVVLLVRVTIGLRGGAVARIWSSMLAGFAFTCVGDVLFGYFSALGRVGLDPYIHVTYLLSYGLMADGARRQRGLLAG
jgi:hypothetical protein